MKSKSEIPTTRLLIRNRIATVGKKAVVQIERVKTEWHNSEESIKKDDYRRPTKEQVQEILNHDGTRWGQLSGVVSV